MRLVITATPLIDRWSVTAANRRDRPTWPPAPDTMFSALVASAASLGNACHPALYWLEQQGCPVIEAEPEPAAHTRISYEPVADKTEWHRNAKKTPDNRKGRHHNSIGAGAVSWSWQVEQVAHLADLQKIAENVTYIGSSRGPVLAHAYVTEAAVPSGALVPVDGTGDHAIRGIYPGRLDELEAAFQSGRRPRPTLEVSYVRHGTERVLSPWADMIPLRADTAKLSIQNTVPLAEAVRAAIMRHIPDGAATILTGHSQDGTTAKETHLAIVPLPRVNDPYADGRLYGVGLMLPQAATTDDRTTLLRGLGAWLQEGGRIDLGAFSLRMEIAANEPRKALQPTRYNGRGQAWSSITPVIFDRHPRRTLTAHDVLSDMCHAVGLPTPEHVEVTPHGLIDGTADARRYSLGGRTYLNKKYRAHVRLQFNRPIPGPVLLGRGQYFGMGVMLPS